jgi:maltose O-acetyltransferase
MKSEKEKMLGGELYNPLDPQLFTERQRVRLLFKAFNDTSDDQRAERLRLLQEIIKGGRKGFMDRTAFLL